MRKKRMLLALMLAGLGVCAGAFGLTGCANNGGNGSSDIEDPEIPLGPGVECEHIPSKIKHEEANKATCMTTGNMEFWYCEDCDTYFADAELTTEIEGGANTVYTIDLNKHMHITPHAAKEATCVEEGNIAYWECEDCGSLYSDEALLEEIDEEGVILVAAEGEGHVMGELIEATSNGCGASVAAHHVCTLCADYYTDEEGNHCNYADIVSSVNHDNLELKEYVECECGAHFGGYYWCPECRKAYADAAGNIETSADEVGHTLIHVSAKPATCTANGNKEYWYCEGGEYFSDAKGANKLTEEEIAELTIVSEGHKATKVNAKGATCTENGNIAYWHCSECGKNFSDEECTKEITLAQTVIPAAHRVTYVPAVAATYEENGVKEHWHCDGCEKDFADEECKEDITGNTVINKLVAHEHKYPENYTYDFVNCEYKKVCADDAEHVEIVEAGSEAYPYIIRNEAELNAVLAKAESGAYLVLDGNIVASENIVINKDVNLDLNGYTVTSSAEKVFEISNATVEIENGNVKANGEIALFANGSTVKLEGVNIRGALFAAIIGNDVEFTMNGGAINGEYGVFNGNNGNITLNGVTVAAKQVGVYCGVLVGGVTVITDCVITSETESAIAVKAGQVEISGSKLTSAAEAFAHNDVIKGAAVGISQQAGGEISVEITGCELNGLYAIYEEADGTIAIALEGENNLNGCVYSKNTGIAAQHTCEGEWVYDYEAKAYVRYCRHNGDVVVETEEAGSEAYPYLANDAASLTAALAEGGYIKLTANITIDDASPLVVAQGTNLDLKGYTIASNSDWVLVVSTSESVIISGGTISSTSSEANVVVGVYEGCAANLVGIRIIGVTGGIEEGVYGVYVTANASVEVTNCTINNVSYGAVACGNNAGIKMNGGNILGSYVGVCGDGNYSGVTLELTDLTVSVTGNAVYNPQEGTTTISGGYYTSGTGSAIAVNAGAVVIDGATLNCNGGTALAISRKSANKTIDVTVENSSLNGVYAILEKGLQGVTITLGEDNELNGYVYSQNCEIGNTIEVVDSAESLLAAVANGGNIAVIEDITLGESVEIENDVTIDLGGHSITSSANRVFNIKNATAEIKNGSIEANNNSYAILANDSTVTLKGVSVNGALYAVAIGNEVNFTMNGGSITGECGIFSDGAAAKQNSVITLNGVTIATKYAGVYAPQVGGVTVINNCNITSEIETAIEIRAGKVTVENSTLTSTNETFKGPKKANGSSIEGAAIGISQHVTNDEITVEINNCTLNGVYAIYEEEVYDKAEMSEITITLGFNTYNGDISSENCEDIVYMAV